MTIEEIKKKYGKEDRDGYIYCQDCPLHLLNQTSETELICDNYSPNDGIDCDGYYEAYVRIHNFFTEKHDATEDNDNVNHPSHYETGKFECIDVMIETQGIEAVKNFCICNAFKYLYRAKKKNGLEDYKKAQWYIKKYIELEGEENDTE